MKQSDKFPPGWDDERVSRVLAHYDLQTEEEAVAEGEAAFEAADQTVMEIPTDLVPKVRELIAKHHAFDVYDVERGILTGKIRRAWPKEDKYEVIGSALDGRPIGIVCRITSGGKVRVITVYEDRPKRKGKGQ